MNQTINSLAKYNVDLHNRLKALETNGGVSDGGDIDKKIQDAVSKINIQEKIDTALSKFNVQDKIDTAISKINIQEKIDASLSKLNVQEKIDVAVTQIKAEILSNIDQQVKEAVSHEAVDIDINESMLSENTLPIGDDIILGVKEEKKTVPKKKAPRKL